MRQKRICDFNRFFFAMKGIRIAGTYGEGTSDQTAKRKEENVGAEK